MNRKGFATIAIVLIALGFVIIGGITYHTMKGFPLPTQNPPHIDFLSPSFNLALPQFGKDTPDNVRAPATRVTIHGSNFTPTSNTVNFIYGPIANLTSMDGQTITFNFSKPKDYLAAHCAGLTVLEDNYCEGMPIGTYPISVTNSNGSSNQVLFNVTPTTESVATSSSGSFNSLGISFQYDPNTITVSLQGNKIYIDNPSDAARGIHNDYFQVFNKDGGDSLVAAIWKTVLIEFSQSQCTVATTTAYPQLDRFTVADIGAVNYNDGTQSGSCKSSYINSGSPGFFMYDPAHPTMFVFWRGGAALDTSQTFSTLMFTNTN